MSWNGKLPKIPSDRKLEIIEEILFPRNEIKEEVSEDGTSLKYRVDYSSDMNLDAVLIDLQQGINDRAVQNTIKEIIDRLIKVRNVLEVEDIGFEDAQYMIVDTGKPIEEYEG